MLLNVFQEPSGLVATKKFMRWMALSAPGDHVDPESLFPQLPQPYRRVRKVLDEFIIDKAWKGITSSFRNTDGSKSSSDGDRSDYEVAKACTSESSCQIPLDDGQEVSAMSSHCLLPIVVAVITGKDSDPFLRVLNAGNDDVRVLGDVPITLPVDTQPAESELHVLAKNLTPLQLISDSTCALAIHLESVSVESQAKSESVNIYAINAGGSSEFSCQCVAVVQMPAESSISSIQLSQDSTILAVSCVDSPVLSFFGIQRKENQETRTLTSPAFQVDLIPTRSPLTEGESKPQVHFLVAPSSHTRVVPHTYAFVVCYGLKVLEFKLPTSSSSVPALLTPVKIWEHLTTITISAQDLTTQFLVVGCQDGSLVVWDLVRDSDYAFLSPSMSSVWTSVICQSGYVVAASKQQLFFFDVRERNQPVLTRAVAPPSSPSSITTVTTSAALLIALVQCSDGMIWIHDVRSTKAIGSLRTSTGVCITGNQDVLATGSCTPFVNVYNWRFLPDLTEEMLIHTAGSSASISPSRTQLETIFYCLAGECPSPQAKKSIPSSPGRASVSFSSLPTKEIDRDEENPVTELVVQLEPLVVDSTAFFERFCRESLNPLEIADKEAKLHRKRRELLKVMATGGVW
ncbi:hypothetical protein P3T76_013191 [Phytophthora citrophthora]|uniref:Uncharacterized protein n=1 Tax=Phytophthora citrophthora TaxID=4793 RepID=A0AAD9G4B7_9STRA|nr:hypothetical protein P3T76_013191 [Phytophthora citrophthora]